MAVYRTQQLRHLNGQHEQIKYKLMPRNYIRKKKDKKNVNKYDSYHIYTYLKASCCMENGTTHIGK